VVSFTLKHAINVSTEGRYTKLPAGTRIEWTDELAVSPGGTLCQFVTANGERFLVDEAELSITLARIT
jgi:hypothetical protein